MAEAVFDFDGTTLRRDQLVAILAYAKAFQDRGKQLEQAVREALDDAVDPGEELNATTSDGTVFATVSKTRGSTASGYRVKDPAAYALWLSTHKRKAATVSVLMPADAAMSSQYVEGLLGETGGELPPGVEAKRPAAATLRVTQKKQEVAKLWSSPEIKKYSQMMIEGVHDGE